MKTIKIDFKNFWGGFDKEDNLFTNLLRENFEVVIDKNPEYMFYSIYPEENKSSSLSNKGEILRKISPYVYKSVRKLYSGIINRNKKIEVPEGNFVKIMYATEDIRPDMDKCDFAFSPFSDINHPNHFEIPVHLICDWYFEDNLPFERKIDFEKIKKEKTKFCNFIYSQEFFFRNHLFKQLNTYKRIDSPGLCMNNMKPIGYDTPKNSRNSYMWAYDKLSFLNQYKFTIACENTADHPYTTEKLAHPFLVNSIPIYLGNKNVDRYFNTKSFINYSDFKSMKDFIEHIKEVDNDDKLYMEYLEQPIFKTKEQYDFSRKERIAQKLKEIIDNKK